MSDDKDNVKNIAPLGDDEQTTEPTQNASDAPTTHFAIDGRTCADLRKLLGTGHDYDDVAHLIRGIESGVPLTLGPAAKP